MSNAIVLNIPHSSINGIFDRHYGKWGNNPHFINECIRKHTDWFTDMLFSSDRENVSSVVFNYSRFVCDVERLDSDPLEKIGQGIIYTEFNGYKRGELSEIEKKYLYKLRDEHYQLLEEKLKSSEKAILVDCHSFNKELSIDTDICLGFNNDFSYDAKLVDLVKDLFEKGGYSVKLNYPYSNSLTPISNDEANYKSIMIEVNKKVYMDEETLMLNPNARQWMRWYGCLDEIYSALSEF